MTKLVAALGMICLASAALADEPAKAEAKPAMKKMAKAPVMIMMADLKWAENPKVKGVSTASLWGDRTKGAHGVIVKFQPGLENPLHTHSHDIKLVVISGTWLAGAEGETPKELGPGSYLMVPGGWKHTSGCKAGAECMFFQESQGAFDMKPVGAGAAK